MNEDETPLHQIIWQRFKKVAGDPPAWIMGEQKAMDALARNWLAVGRALLITIGAFLIIQAYPPDLAGFWKRITTKLPGYETHQAWYLAGVLIVLAVQAHWACGVLLRAWRHCRRTRFAPVAALAGVVIGWMESSASHGANLLSCSSWAIVGWTLFFVSCASRFWTSEESTDDFKDRLQRGYLVERLLDCFKNPRPSLRRIAIMGGWGTGKTVVLRLLRKALMQSATPKFAVTMINPWVSQNIEEVYAMITRAFEEALGYRDYFQNPLARSRWVSVLTSLKVGATTELGFDLQQLFRGGSSSREDELVHRINDTLRASGRVCVILIDDMERAEPEVIRRVFPLIDVLRRIDHCFFVFGIDPTRVARAFKERSASGDQTKGYLDKVFDLQLSLPKARPKDIDNMCRDLIDPKETPKLHAAWDSIKSHLPVVPREANHFMRDAIMREALFLGRYGPDSHDYIGFFKLRILAMELPTIVERINAQMVEDFSGAKYAATMLRSRGQEPDEQTQRNLENPWIQATEGLRVPPSKAPTLRALFEEVLSSGVDLPWACHDHMRLLTLNHVQMLALRKVWRDNVGKRSILDMIPMAVPGLSFDDPDQIATQLLETEFNDYQSIRDRIIVARSPVKADELTGDALERVGNLIAHVRFATSSGLDREFYPGNYFDSWITMMFRGALRDNQESASKLRQRETDCSIATSNLLSTHDAYQIARFPTAGFINQRSMGDGRDDLIPHIDALRTHLQERLYSEFIECIRIGRVAQQSFLSVLGISHLAEVFGDLESWNPFSDNFGALRSLGDEIDGNPQIASSMVAVASSLLSAVEYIARTGNGDRVAFTRQTVSTHPDYVALVWRMALRSTIDRDDLLARHAFTRSRTTSATAITTDQFDVAFPTPSES
jgi:hypothetical protein